MNGLKLKITTVITLIVLAVSSALYVNAGDAKSVKDSKTYTDEENKEIQRQFLEEVKEVGIQVKEVKDQFRQTQIDVGVMLKLMRKKYGEL